LSKICEAMEIKGKYEVEVERRENKREYMREV